MLKHLDRYLQTCVYYMLYEYVCTVPGNVCTTQVVCMCVQVAGHTCMYVYITVTVTVNCNKINNLKQDYRYPVFLNIYLFTGKKKNFYFYRLVTPSTFEIFLLKLVPVQGSTFNGAVVGMSVKQWLQVVVPLKTYQKNTHQKKNDQKKTNQKTNQQLSINHTINQTFQPPPHGVKKTYPKSSRGRI